MQHTIQEWTQKSRLKNEEPNTNIKWGVPSEKHPTWINTYHPNQRLEAARREIAGLNEPVFDDTCPHCFAVGSIAFSCGNHN